MWGEPVGPWAFAVPGRSVWTPYPPHRLLFLTVVLVVTTVHSEERPLLRLGQSGIQAQVYVARLRVGSGHTQRAGANNASAGWLSACAFVIDQLDGTEKYCASIPKASRRARTTRNRRRRRPTSRRPTSRRPRSCRLTTKRLTTMRSRRVRRSPQHRRRRSGFSAGRECYGVADRKAAGPPRANRAPSALASPADRQASPVWVSRRW